MSEQTEATGESLAISAVTPVPTTAPVPGAAALLDPTTVWAVPPHLAQQPRRKRPWVRTMLRWSTAAVLCAAVGTGTAFGVMAPRRADLPGLSTPADGRYVFPALTLPPLPPGAVGPDESTSSHVPAEQRHLADLRQLLLPAPLGAKSDAGFPGARGWFPESGYAGLFAAGPDLTGRLNEGGLRHIAATAWTAPDGTRTEIYLLGFRSAFTASTLYTYEASNWHLKAAPGAVLDTTTATLPGLPASPLLVLAAQAGSGKQSAVRSAVLGLGDTDVLVVMSNPKAVPLVNFQQVVGLQGELLQG